MNAGNALLRERIDSDNQFRLVVSGTSVLLAGILSSLNLLPSFPSVAAVVAVYNLAYLMAWYFLDQIQRLRWVSLVLGALDMAAITITIHFTGQQHSPFFYLYPVPFLVHAFQFDLELIAYDAILATLFYVLLIVAEAHGTRLQRNALLAGQVAFLGVVIGVAVTTSLRLRKKEQATDRGKLIMRTTVLFLERLNNLSPALALNLLEKELMSELTRLLDPLGIHARLWIVNSAWKTLRGIGDHPGLRPGSPQHLPTVACPAFALHRPFQYQKDQGEPCVSEQFNYHKHLCIPISIEVECLGVLFVSSYRQGAWSAEERTLFEMLSHSVGSILQRKKLFENIQEKVNELNFSVEVGATSLATFVGSTQGLEETTLNVLDGVRSILKADRASLMLWDRGSQHLQTQWVRGGDYKLQSPMRLALGEGLAGWALQTGEPYWAEYAMGDPHYVPSGQPILSLICVPVFTLNRQPLGVINALTIKTVRAFNAREVGFLKWFGRQAALAIENAQLHQRSRTNIDQLSDLNQTKSHFLSLVSHDLRGPLTGIRGFCEVLKTQVYGKLNAKQIELIDQLERQIDLQGRMVDDLLDFALMQKKNLSIVPEWIDVQALLREEVNKSQTEAQERKIVLSLKAENLSEPIVLFVDGDRIRQVVWNLIHNALKFTAEGGRILVESQVTDMFFQVDVGDSGVGLSPDTQDKIFDKFFQLSPGGQRGAQGLGLGLAICKEIILAHHGRIHASSAGLGKGTKISFSLPKQLAPAVVLKAA